MRVGRMHAEEAPIDTPLVRRLIATQFPRWADLDIAPVASAGTDNAMYRLGTDMAVRLPRIESAAANVETESHWVPRLAPDLPVDVPVPVGQGSPAHGYPWPWTVVRWLDGENPVVGHLDNAAGLAEDLAGFVTALRTIDTAGGPPASRGVPLGSRDVPTRTAIAELHGLIDTDAVTAAWEDALRLPDEADSCAWIHGDLAPGNILVNDGRLDAVIDFGALGIGDPTVDLIVAWNLLPAVARDVFRAALGVDDTTWLRGRGWALSIALIQLPYYRSTNPSLAANARHVIAEVLADVTASPDGSS
jgi:aminoglycoside phosphotransferase (APT) family kinase protein